VIAESYHEGVSTRKVHTVVINLGVKDLSAASASRMAGELDEQVQAFLLALIEQPSPYLFVDATYYKVREGIGYVTRAALVVAGVREDGYLEILGTRVTNCENEVFWSGMFEELKERDLPGSNWLSLMVTLAFRRRLRPPPSAPPCRSVRSIVARLF